MIRRPPRSTQSRSSAASDVYKRQLVAGVEPGLVVAREEGNEVQRDPRQPVHGKHEHAPPILRPDLLEQQGRDKHRRGKPLECEQGDPDPGAVSYTHLTLPTI